MVYFVLTIAIAIVLGFFFLSNVGSSVYGSMNDSFRSSFPASVKFINQTKDGPVTTEIPLKNVRYIPGTSEVYETPPDCLEYRDIAEILLTSQTQQMQLSESEFQFGISVASVKTNTINILLYAPINQSEHGGSVLRGLIDSRTSKETWEWGTVDVNLFTIPCDVVSAYIG